MESYEMKRRLTTVFGLALFFLSCQNAVSQEWHGSSVPPGDNFFHSVGFQDPLQRQGDYNWILMQEQLASGHPLGTTVQIFEGGLTQNTSIGVIISESPGATATNNGPVNAQANTGSRGGNASGSIEQRSSVAVTNPPQSNWHLCPGECR